MKTRAIDGVVALVILAGAAGLGMAFSRSRHVAPIRDAASISASASSSCLPRPTGPLPTAPPKREVVDALLADHQKSVFLHLDPRRPGVVVPDWLRTRSSLVLQVGYQMSIPIPDLRVDEAGVAGTLSFNQTPQGCVIPWSALYAAVGEDGRGIVWYADVPDELFCK